MYAVGCSQLQCLTSNSCVDARVLLLDDSYQRPLRVGHGTRHPARHGAKDGRINASMACRRRDSRRLTERFSHDASHDQIHSPSFKTYRDLGISKVAKPFSDSSEQCAGLPEAARELTAAILLYCTNTKRSFSRFNMYVAII